MNIEPLEFRIAPASVFTYLDVDSEIVTITSSVGDLTGAVNLVPNGGNQCAGLDLGADFKGANITFTVKGSRFGDGLVNVGYIDAIGVDLGKITIKGDLGNIDCGDGDPAKPALKSLKVRSIGLYGLSTGAGELQSDIVGRLGALVVTGDVHDAFINVADGAEGTIGSVTIGGSVVGSSTFASGVIESSGDMGPVKIGHDVIGGSGMSSGQIASLAKLSSVTVGGSVIGGVGDFSGIVAAATKLGAVKIGRDLIGGYGIESGIVKLFGTTGQIGNVSIGGSLVGGAGKFSGTVFSSQFGIPADTALADVTIRGSVVGGLGEKSGAIFSYNEMGALRIGRDVIGDSGEGSGWISTNGVSKSVLVGGSLVGGSSDDTGVISLESVIGGVKVKGSVLGGAVSAGGNVLHTGVISISHNARSIVIGGDLVGSSVSGSASVTQGGRIFAGVVGSISIGGSLIAGTDSSSGPLSESGAIFAGTVGKLTIKGDIVGNPTNRASIFVPGRGSTDPQPAIGRLIIGGDVTYADIKATPQITGNRNCTIGTVKVGGDWIASSLSSNIDPGASGFWGDFDDSIADAGSISRIVSITIGGDIIGTFAGSDFFGFVADEIGSFKARGLNRANFAGNSPISIETDDVRIVEL